MTGSQALIRSLSDSLDSSTSDAGNSRNVDLPAQDYKVVAPGTLQATTPYFRFFYGKVRPSKTSSRFG